MSQPSLPHHASRLVLMSLLFVGTLAAMPKVEIELLSDEARHWSVVDDRVMGGVSQGAVAFEDGVLIFTGDLSFENNGGFSSIRHDLDRGLEDAKGLRLSVRGDGRSYQLRVQHDGRLAEVAWRTDFTAAAEWMQIELPFEDFRPTFRGRSVQDAGPVRPGDVRQIGLLVADGGQGQFRLEVRSVMAY